MLTALINHDYASTCEGQDTDPTPDCGHPACGLLCDEAILNARHGEARAELRQRYFDGRRNPKAGRQAQQAEIAGLLATGLTLVGVAHFLDVSLLEVLRPLTLRDPADPSAYVDAETLLGQGLGWRRVSAATGLTISAVRSLARLVLRSGT